MRSLPWKKLAGLAGLALIAASKFVTEPHAASALLAVGGALAYYGDHAAEPAAAAPSDGSKVQAALDGQP